MAVRDNLKSRKKPITLYNKISSGDVISGFQILPKNQDTITLDLIALGAKSGISLFASNNGAYDSDSVRLCGLYGSNGITSGVYTFDISDYTHLIVFYGAATSGVSVSFEFNLTY